MRTKIITLITAAFCLTAISSCSKAENENRGKADANGLTELNVKGVLGEYKTEETKASLVNNIRVGWEKDENKKDIVLVFHKEKQKYLGYLVATVQNGDDRTATLSGNIAVPEGDNKTLVFVHGTGLNPSDFTAEQTYESVTLDLSSQSEKTPFMVFGTAAYVAETVSNIIVDFSFATSVVSTYAAGLPASTEVTQATLSDINTKCVLTIPTSGDIIVSGNTSGTITKTEGIGITNADGQVLFEIAVPASEGASSARSIVFTTSSKTYTATFSKAKIEEGKAYSAMSEIHNAEYVAFDKNSTKVFVDATETLTVKVYPAKAINALTWTSSNPEVATVDATGKVTGVAPGTATITAASQSNSTVNDACTVTVSDSGDVVMKMGTGDKEYTLRWATMNLGATTVAKSYTTCYGDLYMWGSVETHYTGFPWTSATTGKFTFKQGISSLSYYTDLTYKARDKETLPDANDVVKNKYPGTDWRMPTPQDFKDLYDACVNDTYDITTNPTGASASVGKGVYWCTDYDGVAGCLFCDGTNKLFFPAAGYGEGTSLRSAGSCGRYWSNSLNMQGTDFAFSLSFDSEKINTKNGLSRVNVFSVRPVSNK